jgi:fructose-bisphosphate aldolase class I
MTSQELRTTCAEILRPGRGILAADESTGTIDKRFKSANITNTEDNRRDYREMLFTTAGMENYVSGVILYDETIRQKSRAGVPLPKVLSEKRVVPGIKVDKGTIALPGAPTEMITQGLDDLGKRLAEYKALGARFAKWRAVITIGPGIPSSYCIRTSAHALARYAAICQGEGIVPIVEPEVLMDADNTIERCEEVTTETLHRVFGELYHQKVELEGMLLKPNMVVSGKKCAVQAPVQEVAQRTLDCFRRTVPAAVPGIVFLSGGQSDEDATAHLGAMNAMGPHPWVLSFSYGRALQAPAIKGWAGKQDNWKRGQAEFFKRAKLNGAAQLGKYKPEMEKEPVAV